MFIQIFISEKNEHSKTFFLLNTEYFKKKRIDDVSLHLLDPFYTD